MGQFARLNLQDAVLDLVKKAERAKEKPTQSRDAVEIGKTHKEGFVSNPISSKLVKQKLNK